MNNRIIITICCLGVFIAGCRLVEKHPPAAVSPILEPLPAGQEAVYEAKKYTSVVYIPKNAESLFYAVDILEKNKDISVSIAFPYNFAEDRSDLFISLKDRVKKLHDEGRLGIIFSLKTNPVLPLIADNSSFLMTTFLSDTDKPIAYRWPQDIRDQVMLEKEEFKKIWGIETDGFLPYGGMVDEQSLKPLLACGVKYIICGSEPETTASIVKISDLYLVCAAKRISELTYASNDGVDESAYINAVTQALTKNTQPQIILVDESYFEKKTKHSGRKYFQGLMSALLLTDAVFVLPQNFIRENPDTIPARKAKEVAIGSWIADDMTPWIGEPEENVAWEMLAKCRQSLEDYKDSGSADIRRLDSALQEIYAAESGNNFYYFGKDFESQNEQEIDQLFRAGLLNVYRLIKESPPEELYKPINLFKGSGGSGEKKKILSTVVEKSETGVVWNDPEGDDYGDGRLIYPSIELLDNTTGLADIRSFGFNVYESSVVFQCEFTRLDNFWNAPLGFSFPLIDIYIDLNNRYGAGSSAALPDRKAVFSEQDGWEYVIVINGWAARLYRSASDVTVYKVAMLDCMKINDTTIRITVPRNIMRGNPFNWGYSVLVMGYSRYSLKDPPAAMGVDTVDTGNNLLSTKGIDVSPVIDIILPEQFDQKDILKLNPYMHTATIPLLRVE